MSTDYRNGIDVMTTETTCLSSIWRTDEDTKKYLTAHGRGSDYKKLEPKETAYYDGCIYIDLSPIHSMIALPFHPSNGYEIRELNENMDEILHEVEENAKKLIKNPDLQLNLEGKSMRELYMRIREQLQAVLEARIRILWRLLIFWKVKVPERMHLI